MARPPGGGGGGSRATNTLAFRGDFHPLSALALVGCRGVASRSKLSADLINPPKTLAARQDQLLAALLPLRDPQARFSWAVEQARRRPPLPVELRVDANRVEGCQVRLWFVAEFSEGRCRFRTDSDAVTLKAMTGLLCDLGSDSTPAEIVAHDFAFLEQLGLVRQLAENRRATVLRVADQIRAFAIAHA